MLRPYNWDAGSLRAGSRSCRSRRLPPVMREGAVRLRHPVRVLFLLYRLALTLRGEDQLGGEPLRHVLLAAGAAGRDQPAHTPRGAPPPPPLPPHLGGRAAPPPRLPFQRRLHIGQGLL